MVVSRVLKKPYTGVGNRSLLVASFDSPYRRGILGGASWSAKRRSRRSRGGKAENISSLGWEKVMSISLSASAFICTLNEIELLLLSFDPY